VISQFLADSFPSHLLPASDSSPTAPLTRAKIAFFADTWTTKLTSLVFGGVRAGTSEDKQKKAEELVAIVKKEIEPLLEDAGPYFGGSEKLTLAEVCDCSGPASTKKNLQCCAN
jgi:glutathione S-transferase